MIQVKPVTPQTAFFMASIIARVLNEAHAWFEQRDTHPTRGQLAGMQHLERCHDEYVAMCQARPSHELCQRSEDIGRILDSDMLTAHAFVLKSLMYACSQARVWYGQEERRVFQQSLRALCHTAEQEYRAEKHCAIEGVNQGERVAMQPYFS